MKKAKSNAVDDLRPEYKREDFGVLVRGKYSCAIESCVKRRRAPSRGRERVSKRRGGQQCAHGLDQSCKVRRAPDSSFQRTG